MPTTTFLLAALVAFQDPPKDGLELWLDAAAINGEPDSAVGAWLDGSGKGRDLSAPSPAEAPRLVREAGATFVRFDGEGSRLQGRWGLQTEDLTVILVFAPRSNRGGFCALFSGSAPTKNDYVSGINVDFGAGSGDLVAALNVEGAGMPGQSNLLKQPLRLETSHVLALTSTRDGTSAWIDGVAAGRRTRSAGKLSLEEFRLGSRRYSNESPNPYDQGFFEGDVAEVLLYTSALSDEQLAALTARLQKKHAAFLGRKGAPAPVLPKEPLTMLAPGFEVRPLPVELTNLNNIEYGPDGTLTALGYDGRVHVLRDTDGDGLEDRSELVFDGEGELRAPIGMALAPEGVYVASKGRISLIANGKATIVAQGWKEIPHGVDALGVALDAKGNLYFGLGCHDFTNIYKNYDRRSERGTILRVSPDRKTREILCTGIRFPVALAFNPAGDLFATDQEGETWCPSGNPLDKLVHVEQGRHYGFPPKLPSVVDEPATVSFGPQHQSTCGLKFNERFGPASWAGDAIVTGYSRGKLWRVPLAKTAAGYVGRPVQIASLTMLPVDIALSPKGEMVVSCHSGGPDWGTGPKGAGKLFKVRYRGAPQPVAAWASGPMEARIAFDRPIDLQEEAKSVGVVFGEHVGPADRLEVFSPPYKAVEEQKRAPKYRGDARATLSEDRRTLILSTRQPVRARYAVALSRNDLAYELTGVAATWTGADGSWSGWLPHVDPVVVARQTRGSAEHERLLSLLEKPGLLRLRTRLDLPGQKLTVNFVPSLGTKQTVDFVPGEAAEVPLEVPTGQGFTLTATYRTEADPRERAIPMEGFLLPWAPTARPPRPLSRGTAPELVGGDWARGRALFFGDAKCGSCHPVRGEGGKAGPDLGNLVHLDPKAVLQNIVEPNASINPDFAAYRLELRDGDVLVGIVQTDGPDAVRLIGPHAEPRRILRSEIRDLRPSRLSLMPDGYAQLGETRLRDLLTFLTTTPAQAKEPPPRRSRAEVEAVLKATPTSDSAPRPLKVLLVANPKDHGPNEHDYPWWQKKWAPLLAKLPQTTVETAFPWPTAQQWAAADVAVLFLWGKWDGPQVKDVDAFLGRGGGLVCIHSAVIPQKEAAPLAALIGLAWEPGKTKFRHGALEMEWAEHPITAGLPKARFVDESYWPLLRHPSKVQVLGTTVEEAAPRPMAWVFEPGKGRAFSTLLGHYTWTFDDPFFRVLVLRGMAWAAREPLGRFDAALLDGATLSD